jgi:hypothetical protein
LGIKGGTVSIDSTPIETHIEQSLTRVEDSSSLLHLVELVDLLHFLWYLEFVNDKI